MKIVSVEYADSVDISAFAVGDAVSVNDGTTTISGGKILAVTLMANSESTLVPHTHNVASGTATIPATSTGPAVPT